MVVCNNNNDALNIPGYNDRQEGHAELLRVIEPGKVNVRYNNNGTGVHLPKDSNLLEKHAEPLKEIKADEEISELDNSKEFIPKRT